MEMLQGFENLVTTRTSTRTRTINIRSCWGPVARSKKHTKHLIIVLHRLSSSDVNDQSLTVITLNTVYTEVRTLERSTSNVTFAFVSCFNAIDALMQMTF